MIVLLGVGMYHGFAWLADTGATWGESNVGVVPQTVWTVLVWILSIGPASASSPARSS